MEPPRRNLAWLAKHHFGRLRWASFALCLCPALWLFGEWWRHALGVNPLNRLLHFTGTWSLVMLTITLSVTPARRLSITVSRLVHARYGKRLSDWNWLIRLRRQFGLFTFFYACLHVAGYVAFDAGPSLTAILDDVAERPFILVGFASFVLLLPLAATSTQSAMRALGGLWRRLHLLTYLVAVLALVHFWSQAKVGELGYLPYVVVLGLLLGVRLCAWWRGDRSTDGEAKER
jgi:sulfoxide reductase heme-binding subunit YedZ